jgi:hypothetical protein
VDHLWAITPSHAALARAFGVSKSLVQRRIARAAKVEGLLAEEDGRAPVHRRAQAGRSAMPDAPDPHAPVNVREQLQKIARGRDQRSALGALKMLQEMDGDKDDGRSQDGLELPWPAGETSARVYFYSVPGEPDLASDAYFTIHRGQVGNDKRPSILVYPLPVIALREPTPEEQAETQTALA